MRIYQTKLSKLPGTNYSEVRQHVWRIYRDIKSKSKRRTYLRMAYFKKEKVFIDTFWNHLAEKNLRDRTRRLKYYECAIDLIRKTKFQPITKTNPNKKSEILHRFGGLTAQNELFYVHIKEDRLTHQKYLISIFPADIKY